MVFLEATKDSLDLVLKLRAEIFIVFQPHEYLSSRRFTASCFKKVTGQFADTQTAVEHSLDTLLPFKNFSTSEGSLLQGRARGRFVSATVTIDSYLPFNEKLVSPERN